MKPSTKHSLTAPDNPHKPQLKCLSLQQYFTSFQSGTAYKTIKLCINSDVADLSNRWVSLQLTSCLPRAKFISYLSTWWIRLNKFESELQTL